MNNTILWVLLILGAAIFFIVVNPSTPTAPSQVPSPLPPAAQPPATPPAATQAAISNLPASFSGFSGNQAQTTAAQNKNGSNGTGTIITALTSGGIASMIKL